ncbi:MAG: hypothetical protein KOO63_05270 [Bacteroidales bacterium]|nr:hypothetical protein [Candidatus Latescibacterota bacterium]
MTDRVPALSGVSPAMVLREIAAAIPADCKGNMIIIGSLAVGFRYFGQAEKMVVRTKDADCLLSPNIEAVQAGVAITEQLLHAKWSLRSEGEWTVPGNENTPDDQLPMVRLHPPQKKDWFLELLTVPESAANRRKTWQRMQTKYGDFTICSFGYLSLTNFKPLETEFGIFIARPEMMALANLLEHPKIGPEAMSGGFGGRDDVKRSNKDLGRVVAIARLATGEDEDALLTWADSWLEAMKCRFVDDWRELAAGVGSGLRELLASPADFEEAYHTCVTGLLAEVPPSLEGLQIAAQRLLADVVRVVEEAASISGSIGTSIQADQGALDS